MSIEAMKQEPLAWHHPDCEGQCLGCLIEAVAQENHGDQGLTEAAVKKSYGSQGLEYLRKI